MARLAALFLLLIAAPALALAPGELDQFARALGIRDVGGFAATVTELRAGGRLPPRYLTKEEAQRAGWSPGRNICAVLPGRAIGGDRFKNAERQLPEKQGRRWHEADLDTPCGNSRGAKRLVFSSDGLQFVTVDHYKSFTQVPP
jgi:ribonuclease T1